MGQAKQEKYAMAFINLITAHKASQKQKPKLKGSTFEVTKELIEAGLTIEEIAEQRQLQVGTIYTHLIKLHEQGMPIDFYQFIAPEEITKITDAKIQIENPESLKSFFDFFEEQIPYWKIRMALYLSDTQ